MSVSRRAIAFNCDDCGRIVSRIIRDDRPRICSDCAMARITEAAYQLGAKSGPYYEKWLASKGVAGRPRRHPNGE